MSPRPFFYSLMIKQHYAVTVDILLLQNKCNPYIYIIWTDRTFSLCVSAISYVNIVYLYQHSTFLQLCTSRWLMKLVGNLSCSRRNRYLQFFYYNLVTIRQCLNAVDTTSLKRDVIVQCLIYI